MEYKYTSRSITDTMELEENIESEKFPGMVICLDGELGSGKTVFVKGFAKSLGITETITSPTFNLIKEYNSTISPMKSAPRNISPISLATPISPISLSATARRLKLPTTLLPKCPKR